MCLESSIQCRCSQLAKEQWEEIQAGLVTVLCKSKSGSLSYSFCINRPDTRDPDSGGSMRLSLCALSSLQKTGGAEEIMSHPRQLQTYSWSSRITSCGLVVEYWCCSQNLYRFLRWHNHCEVCQSPQLLKCRSTATWRDFGGDEMDCWFEMSLVLKSLNSGKWEGTDFWQLKLSKTHWVFLFWVKNLY